MFTNITRRAWMVGLPVRAKNVIAAYGENDPTFSKNKLIAAIKSGDFPKRAVNAGPVITDIIKKHLKIEDSCLS